MLMKVSLVLIVIRGSQTAFPHCVRLINISVWEYSEFTLVGHEK